MSKEKLLFVIIYFFVNINLFACECMCTKSSFKDAIERSDEIFTGEIIKIEKVKNGFHFFENEKMINWIWKYSFKVEEKWKGNKNSIVIIYFVDNGCGLFNSIDTRYLVYASRFKRINPNSFFLNKDKRLWTWVCSRTTGDYSFKEDEERTIEKDIEQLNKKFPNKIKISKYQFGFKWLIIISLLLIIGTVLRKKNLTS